MKLTEAKLVSRKTILAVDDDSAIRDMLELALSNEFDVLTAENAQIAHALVIDQQPDIVLLDWMMPGTSGLEFLRRLRRHELTSSTPVILLTARSEEDSKIAGFDSGADDFITKPFSPRELISRVKAVLRRTQSAASEQPITVGELYFDPVGHRVTISGQPIELGPTEFRLLRFFIQNQERVYNRDQILDHVWGGNVYLDERTVDVHIRRLRKAVSISGHEKYIQTVRGSGYRFSTQIL